jgi:hypothetical protein
MMKNGLFPGGALLMTPAVRDRVADDAQFAEFFLSCLRRHFSGDWGDLEPEDKNENDLSVKAGFRILSAYVIPGSQEDKIWVITEADRSATTVLFPEEY